MDARVKPEQVKWGMIPANFLQEPQGHGYRGVAAPLASAGNSHQSKPRTD
jgi:hypothetical protein